VYGASRASCFAGAAHLGLERISIVLQIHIALVGAAFTTIFAAMPTRAQDADARNDIAHHNAELSLEYRLDPYFQQKVDTGLKISPVPLALENTNPILVGLGSYIVNAQSGCSDCHTNPAWAPGGNPFMGQPKQVNVAGFLAGGQSFGPGIVSRNLTPENGLPAGRTFAQFKQILRTGVDLDHAHPQIGPLLQVMPWPAFQNMSDRDLIAVYAYLSAIPAIAPKN